MIKRAFLPVALAAFASFFPVAGVARSIQATAATPPAQGSAAAKAQAKAMPSDADIAAAKAKGLVWVNLNTKVYHKDDAMYGKTKNGKFMTEADAQKAGARMAKTSPSTKKSN